MSWPDVGSPLARDLLLSIRTMAEADPNCPNHVRFLIQQKIPDPLCDAGRMKDGCAYEKLVDPTAWDEVHDIHQDAATAVASPRPAARLLWLSIKTDLENFPSGNNPSAPAGGGG